MLLRKGETPRWALDSLGTALGFEPGLEFERTELDAARGRRPAVLHRRRDRGLQSARRNATAADRLLADAGAVAGQSASAMTTGLLQKVRAFAGGAPQSDDIAILALRVSGRRRDAMTLELQATPEEVMRAVEALQEFGQRNGRCAEKDLFGLALALEECGSNIVNHALQRDARQKFQVMIEHAGGALSVELRDRGPAFDPYAGPSA